MSNFNIKDRQVKNVTVLDLDGNLRIGEGNLVLHKTIRRLLDEGRNQILLNLAGVAYIDSSGLGEIIASHTTLHKSGGQIKLLHLTQRVRELMTITKLLTIFDAYDNESDALNSFQSSASDTENQPPTLVKEVLPEPLPV